MIFQLDAEAEHPYITLGKTKVTEGKVTVVGFGDTDIGPGLVLGLHCKRLNWTISITKHAIWDTVIKEMFRTI
jgi:hypothetical protein